MLRQGTQAYRNLLILVLLGLSLSATAGLTTVTAAYEVAVTDLRLPVSVNGTLTFKQCPDCDAQTLRVTSKTRYVLNDRNVGLAEFKNQLKRVRNRKTEAATVMHHLESNTITAISVNL